MTRTQQGSDVRKAVHAMWATVAGAWETNATDVDDRAAAITEHMLSATNVSAGHRVLELASGPGGAGLAAAERVGSAGEVVITDVVSDMVDIARRRADDRGLTNVCTRVLDLENIAEPDGAYDVVLCREGLMFALDPAHGATEMYRVLRPGGRVAVAVWASREDNPWLGLVLDAITEVTGIVVPPPGVPGPFALADSDNLRELFFAAGFDALRVGRVGAPLRSPSFGAWWSRTLTVAGPVVGILNALDATTRDRLQQLVRNRAARYAFADALELPGMALVVTGQRP